MAMCCVLLCLLATIIVLGLAGGLSYHYFRPNSNPWQDFENLWPNIEEFVPTLEQFHRESPFNATSPNDADRWQIPKGTYGLHLEVLNALEDKWDSYFQTALSDWDNGTPDVLSLSTTRVSIDSNCSEVEGVMKVCNGNYGNTGWYGINYAVVTDNYITSSVALMNEYYLDRSSESRKQYTMCHEMGHGFGLPHTDENFWNANLNNCLDYTNSPKDNMHPSSDNFKFLAVMYGTLDGPWTGGANNTAGGSNGDSTQTQSSTESGKLRFRGRRMTATHKQTPANVLTKFHKIRSELERNGVVLGYQGGRLLRQSSHFINYEIDLGSNHVVQIHKLLERSDEDDDLLRQ